MITCSTEDKCSALLVNMVEVFNFCAQFTGPPENKVSEVVFCNFQPSTTYIFLFLMSPAMYDLTTFMAYGAPTGKYM
jgi:hypothetical protein